MKADIWALFAAHALEGQWQIPGLNEAKAARTAAALADALLDEFLVRFGDGVTYGPQPSRHDSSQRSGGK